MTSPRTLRNFIGGTYVDGSAGATSDVVDPTTGQVVAQAPVSGAEEVDAAYEAADRGLRRVGTYDAQRAPAGAAEDRRRDRVPRRGADRPRVGQHRQDQGAHRERGDPADGGPAPVLRRGGPRAGGQGGGRVHGGAHLVDPSRADRRRRPGHPVELPAADGGVEDRPGPRRRQHRRPQAERHHPREHAAAGRARLRVPPGRDAQRRHRRPRDRAPPRRAPDARARRDHRLGPRRRRGRGERRPAGQAGAPRAGRQGAGRGLRRRRHRGRGRGHRDRRLLQRRPGLHGRHPRPGRPRHPRRLRGGARRLREGLGTGRACPTTRTPSSAPSTTPRSWPG